ncbi:M48 family metallopeptidase [Phytoactinopolyspora mesophila]|uniref:M48 family metalloprotease n=1 Tax=Phytoactinopolyspora mesophila TaxID=2650750 RepID=A0A7K3M1Y0_9ACTN|nr:M48 family metallopeptidase [Phytoactinopolyspora mesophila]NDL57306.1 M48 family metalloprotease [Phytoactinopolyspora mesophila]
MRTTLRALVAVALLGGFYLLVGLVVAAAVVIDVALIVRGDGQGLQAAIAITLVAFALIRALVVVSRQQMGEPPGIPVSPDDEPALWQTVDQLAEQVQTAPPDEIRIVGDVNAAVSEDTKFLGLKATRRRMYIGMPLLTTMTVDEMRSILGHELGHYSGSHTRLGAPVYRGRTSLVATVQGLDNHPLVRKIFVGYAKFFFRVSQSVSRRQELEADEHSVAIAGRAAASSALRKVHGLAPAWGYFIENYARLIGPANARPADMFGGFHSLVSDPVRQREMAAMISEEREHSPYDSHPSLPDRLANIERQPDRQIEPDERPAIVLLRDPSSATQKATEWFLSEEALAMPTASWEDIVARGMYVVSNRNPAADLALLGQRLTGAPHPYLDTAFEAMLRGQSEELRAALVNVEGWPDDARLLDHVIARALEAALIEHGSAYWALSWSSQPRLLDLNGQELKLDDFAAAIVADPASQVPAVRDWLTRSGIGSDYTPQYSLDPARSADAQPTA